MYKTSVKLMAKHSPLYALIQLEHPFLANTFWST